MAFYLKPWLDSLLSCFGDLPYRRKSKMRKPVVTVRTCRAWGSACRYLEALSAHPSQVRHGGMLCPLCLSRTIRMSKQCRQVYTHVKGRFYFPPTERHAGAVTCLDGIIAAVCSKDSQQINWDAAVWFNKSILFVETDISSSPYSIDEGSVEDPDSMEIQHLLQVSPDHSSGTRCIICCYCVTVHNVHVLDLIWFCWTELSLVQIYKICL